jgi:hypothetical protein
MTETFLEELCSTQDWKFQESRNLIIVDPGIPGESLIAETSWEVQKHRGLMPQSSTIHKTFASEILGTSFPQNGYRSKNYMPQVLLGYFI